MSIIDAEVVVPLADQPTRVVAKVLFERVGLGQWAVPCAAPCRVVETPISLRQFEQARVVAGKRDEAGVVP